MAFLNMGQWCTSASCSKNLFYNKKTKKTQFLSQQQRRDDLDQISKMDDQIFFSSFIFQDLVITIAVCRTLLCGKYTSFVQILNLQAGDRPHGVANGCIALSGESHNNPACGGTVHLADHEVDLACHLTQTPRVVLPVVPIQSYWNGQQLQNVYNFKREEN